MEMPDLDMSMWRITYVRRQEKEDYDEDDYRAWKAAKAAEAAEAESGRDCDYDDEDNI